MLVYQCPECGNRGEPGFMTPEPYAFEVRGRLRGKNVYKCGRCGAGLRRCSFFGRRLETLAPETWREIQREWEVM